MMWIDFPKCAQDKRGTLRRVPSREAVVLHYQYRYWYPCIEGTLLALIASPSLTGWNPLPVPEPLQAKQWIMGPNRDEINRDKTHNIVLPVQPYFPSLSLLPGSTGTWTLSACKYARRPVFNIFQIQLWNLLKRRPTDLEIQRRWSNFILSIGKTKLQLSYCLLSYCLLAHLITYLLFVGKFNIVCWQN